MSTTTPPRTARFAPLDPLTGTARQLRVLVAEPAASVCGRLVATLREEGCEVVTADSGEAAIAHLDIGSTDLAVLDVVLPGLGGLEVVRRARLAGRGMPLLLLTTSSAVSIRVEALTAGADDVVPAPFEMDELLARLTVLLRRSGARGSPEGRGRLDRDPEGRTAR